jgi:PAS domain S-box-containing protein
MPKVVDKAAETRTPDEQFKAYRAMFDQNPLAAIFWNTKFEVVEWNEAATRMFGFTADEVIGKRAEILVPEPVRGHVEQVWEELLRGQPQRTVNANVTKDGRTILCEWNSTPVVDEKGEVLGVASIAADVTERHRESDALKRSEARFRSLIELGPDAICVVRGGRFLYVNPALARYLGYDSSEELLALPTTVITPADQIEKTVEQMAVLLRRQVAPPVEYTLRRKNGDLVTCEVMIMQIDFDGEPATLSTMRDLSERKQMQARLLQSDRMASVGTLAAGVAHEINNPLAYMKTNLDVLVGRALPDLSRRLHAIDDEMARVSALRELLGQDAGDLAVRLGEIASMVAIVQEGTERVRGIVRDLKTFSRADDETRAPVDVARVLDASVNLAWNEIRHRATLTREYGDVPPVEANESRLGQVFLNLLLNAAQAIPDGDVVSHEIRIHTAVTEGGQVQVSVSDTGVGIPKEARARVFDPFYTTKPEGVGTGLGLWVCQGIVTALGGKIDVESQERAGTRVIVTLPTRYAFHADGEPAPAYRRGRVLVIGEEPVLGSALSIALYAEHDVIASTSGKDAIALLRRHGLFDVVFCEAELPDMTAIDVYRNVVRDIPALAPRFVFAVGRSVRAEVEAELAALPNERVSRPFDVGTLIQLVRSQIQRTRPSLLVPRAT